MFKYYIETAGRTWLPLTGRSQRTTGIRNWSFMFRKDGLVTLDVKMMMIGSTMMAERVRHTSEKTCWDCVKKECEMFQVSPNRLYRFETSGRKLKAAAI